MKSKHRHQLLTILTLSLGLPTLSLGAPKLTAGVCRALLTQAPQSDFDYIRKNYAITTACQKHYSCQSLYSEPNDQAKCANIYGKMELAKPNKPKKPKRQQPENPSLLNQPNRVGVISSQQKIEEPRFGAPPEKPAPKVEPSFITHPKKFGTASGHEFLNPKTQAGDETTPTTAPPSTSNHEPQKTAPAIRWY